jgi:hypothetical protein
MAITEEILQQAEELLRGYLENNFRGQFVFGPIIIELSVDHYGDDNLNIVVVYDGDGGRLDPHKLNSIGADMELHLHDMGIEGASGAHYIEKSEYPEWLELTDPANWMVELTEAIESPCTGAI